MKMNCQQVQDKMADHSVGLLDPITASDYEAHVACCATCGMEAHRFERCLSVLNHMSRPEPPADLWLGLRARLELERSVRGYAPSAPVARAARSWWSGAVAATVGFACALALLYTAGSPATPGAAVASNRAPAVSVSLHNGVDSDSPVADAGSSVAVDATTVRPLPRLSVSLARFAPDSAAEPSFIPSGAALR